MMKLRAGWVFASVALIALGAPLSGVGMTDAHAQSLPETSRGEAALPPPPRDYGSWGVDLTSIDPSVRPGDDFDAFANGSWRARTDIPADLSVVGSGRYVRDLTESQLRQIIGEASKDSQIGALFASFMDTQRVGKLGIGPLRPRLAALSGVADRRAFTRFMGSSKDDFGSALIELVVIPDPANPAINILAVTQSGLGLPNRDYYLEERYAAPRSAYRSYLERIFTMTNQADPAETADAVMAFETSIARVHWTAADSRSIDKVNNPMVLSELADYAPGIEWPAMFSAMGIEGDPKMIVAEKTAIRDIARLYESTPLNVLKAWQTARVVNDASPYLSDEFVQSKFQLQSALSGATEIRPRWTRAIQLIDGSLGELLGQAYVERYFPASAKSAMETLVANLKAAMASRIKSNEWMEDATKSSALEKLEAMEVLVGYPTKFRDYSGLDLRPDDLLGNVARVRKNEWRYERAKLGQPVDRSLWSMTPQTVNAYNGGLENKIVFPAGILQPPFFNVAADDAVNYGAIGAVIGHEIVHGFDDQGRKIDKTGAIRDWWTQRDAARFDERAKRFGGFYAKFEPVPGHFVNPDLTMGENIADMAGLLVALDAYHLSLGGKAAPVINGYTGEQRFFLAFAQVWQNKLRDQATIERLASDPHSPPRQRILGPLPHIDAWYEAFGIGPDSSMYIAPEDRVRVW